MEQHSPTEHTNNKIYAIVGDIVTRNFPNELHDPDIVEKVMGAVATQHRTPDLKEIVTHIIVNRQLISENFK